MTTCEDRIAKSDGEGANQCESLSPQKGFCCEIRVKGYLDSSWSDWFEGMEVKCIDNGETLLCGLIVDQAALMGLLNKLNRLNLPLISMNEVKTRNDDRSKSNQSEFEKMENENRTDKDREMAQVCLNCPCCKIARQEQKGLMYSCVKNFTEGLCPFCQAYERVYGRKAHEPIPTQETKESAYI